MDELSGRIARLQPDATPRWGSMTAAQALAHCAESLRMALGEINPPRQWLGRVFGRLAKQSLIASGEPMRRNTRTADELIVNDHRDFAIEQRRLLATIDRFVVGGQVACTTHPHLFMGPLTPIEWAILMYQHLDHHLRQFGA